MDTTQTNLVQVNDVTKNKLSFLDGFRGLAALWVLTSHCLSNAGFENAPHLLLSGSTAVDIFIILSGFLMTFHYHKREESEPWESHRTWIKFYIRRFFRIAPLYYLLLIIAFHFNDYIAHSAQLVESFYPHKWFAEAYGTASNFFSHVYEGPNLRNVLVHITFLFGLLPHYATSTPLPDWSIGLEMQFYAVFPALMLAFKRFSYFWATILILGIGSIARKLSNYVALKPSSFSEAFPLPSFLPLKIELFLIGILLASAYYHRLRNPLLQASLVGLAILLSAHNGSPVILSVCVLISLIAFYDKLKDPLRIKRIIQIPEHLLSSRLAAFIADTSYSVYLLHLLIMVPLAASLLNFSPYISLPGVVRFSILFLAVVPPTYGISWLLYNYVEKPGIKLGKNLLNSRRFQSANPAKE